MVGFTDAAKWLSDEIADLEARHVARRARQETVDQDELDYLAILKCAGAAVDVVRANSALLQRAGKIAGVVT